MSEIYQGDIEKMLRSTGPAALRVGFIQIFTLF